MPSTSKKQHNFMAAIANSPSFAKKVGVSQSVGKDFTTADKGKTFKRGGDMKESKSMEKKEFNFFKKKGAPASMIKHEKAEIKGMKKGGMTMRPAKDIAADQMAMAPYEKGGVAKMAMGGNINPKGAMSGSSRAGENTKIQKKGLTEGRVIKMASGGFVRGADGIATKGKTRGTMC
jgi:hypothetical protein